MLSVKEIRAEIESEYRVVDGLIRNPGKFEGEAVYVPYYWDLVMEGEGEEVMEVESERESPRIRFVVDSEEEAAFADVLGGELRCGATVELFEDSQGFVIGTVIA